MPGVLVQWLEAHSWVLEASFGRVLLRTTESELQPSNSSLGEDRWDAEGWRPRLCYELLIQTGRPYPASSVVPKESFNLSLGKRSFVSQVDW